MRDVPDLMKALRDSLVPCPVCGAIGTRPCLDRDGVPIEDHDQRHPEEDDG